MGNARIEAVFLLLAASVLASGGEHKLSLPSELAGYREWHALTREPVAVPRELWVLCSRPTADQRAEAYREHGVHAERYIKVHANPVAAAVFPDRAGRRFPVGSVLAKEKLLDGRADSREGVAFMVRRGEPRFRETGGWEFLYFSGDAEKTEVHEACAACHRNAPAGDYVLGSYPNQASERSGSADPPSERDLFRTVSALDRAVFDAVNACDLKAVETFFVEDLEFYHDNGGLIHRSRQGFVESVKNNLCGKVRRELVPGTIEVYPMRGYGAVEIGVHRFHHPGREATEPPGEARFIHLWQNNEGAWRITRIISFDHHAAAK